MALRTLQKWHGAGNDFLVDVIEDGSVPWWNAQHARSVCSRATGVGADGLLVATVGSEVSMVLFNADGSQAEMSGNGIRCLAAAVRHATHAQWSSLEVHTLAGPRTVTLEMDEYFGYGAVDMGEVTFAEPLEGTLGVAFVGNPHVVVLDQPQWSDARRVELAASWSEAVGGANVEFVSQLDTGGFTLRVIERGVGWTLACGTGSCASTAVLHRGGMTGNDVVVQNPGGALRVRLDGAKASLSGPVQFIANVEWLEA